MFTSTWSGSATTANSIATQLAAQINTSPYVTASVTQSSGTINISARSAGVAGNYAVSASSSSSHSSFAASASGTALTGGADATPATPNYYSWNLAPALTTLYFYD